MSQTIQFSVGGVPIGTATIDGAGTLTYENDDVREIMAGRCARVGGVNAFQMFSNWSNGYVVASLTDS
ncbi:MAG: hypothetical protein V4515_14875 [Chloroflexota bacterium]